MMEKRPKKDKDQSDGVPLPVEDIGRLVRQVRRLLPGALAVLLLAVATPAGGDEGQIVEHVHRYTQRGGQYPVDCRKPGGGKGTKYCFRFVCPEDGDYVYGSCGGCA